MTFWSYVKQPYLSLESPGLQRVIAIVRVEFFTLMFHTSLANAKQVAWCTL